MAQRSISKHTTFDRRVACPDSEEVTFDRKELSVKPVNWTPYGRRTIGGESPPSSMTPDTLGTIRTGLNYPAAGATIAQVSATILSVYVAASLVILEVARQRYGRSFANLVRPMRTVWPGILLSGLTILSGILTSLFEAPDVQFWITIVSLILLAVSIIVIGASIGSFFRDSMSDEVLSRRISQLSLADFTTPPEGPDRHVQRLSATVHGADKMAELTAIGSVFIRSSDWQALSKMNDIVQGRIAKLAVETDSREVRENMVSAMCLMWDQLVSESVAGGSATAIRILIQALSGMGDAWDAAHLPLADSHSAFDSLESMGTRALSNGMRELLDPCLGVVETLVKRAVTAARSVVAKHPDWHFSRNRWVDRGIAVSDEEDQAFMDWFLGAVVPTRVVGAWALESVRMHDEEAVSKNLDSLEQFASLAFDEELPSDRTAMVTDFVFSQAEEILLVTSVRPRRYHYTADLSPYTLFLLEKSLFSSKDGTSEVTASLQRLLQRIDINSQSLSAIVEGAVNLAAGIVTVDRTRFPERWLNALRTILQSVAEVLEKNMSASPATVQSLALTTAKACTTMLTAAKEQGWQEARSALDQILLRLNLLMHPSS